MVGDHPSFGNLERRPRPAIAAAEAIDLLRSGSALPASLLAYGNGRSYGDSCHNSKGRLIDMRAAGRILAFDAQTGILEAEAGTLLADIIECGRANGHFPAVLPGTRFVTLGGAIANDIHGKNHHRAGTFGRHVESLVLLRSDGHEYACSLQENADLFRATIGGMGLTGLILSAAIRLRSVPSLYIDETAIPFASLEEYFACSAAVDVAHEYSVAWIDQLAPQGSGVLLAGNHAEAGEEPRQAQRFRLGVPFEPRWSLINRPFMRLFNAAYRRAKIAKGRSRRTAHRAFFFPLDGIADWNRLYGRAGLYQHQSVLPDDAAPAAIAELLQATRRAGQASFLTVLKRFGALASPGLLSFPRPGYTLTLDFANQGEATRKLLGRLDEITVAAGGAVNPYKDARMGSEVFTAGFPNWPELELLRDPAFQSDFWMRTAMRAVAELPVRTSTEPARRAQGD